MYKSICSSSISVHFCPLLGCHEKVNWQLSWADGVCTHKIYRYVVLLSPFIQCYPHLSASCLWSARVAHTTALSPTPSFVAQPEKLELWLLSTTSEDRAKKTDLEEKLQHVCVKLVMDLKKYHIHVTVCSPQLWTTTV